MAATQAQINGAINNGVAWLVTQQNSSTGYWLDAGTTVGPTGLALTKLEERAYELGYTPFDPCYPYEPNVEKGLAYLFSQARIMSISVQPAGNPDTDGDGNGVYMNSSVPVYETGIAMMAIAASRAPDRIVNVSGSPVNGWTYKKVLQNMVDYMAYGQSDSGSSRGGWRYSPNSGADNSCSGYAVEGLGYAESCRYGFFCTIPQFVKNELKYWIDYIQIDSGDSNGGSGYTSPGDGANILRTGNLVFQMTFAQIPLQDPNMQRALSYMGSHWSLNPDSQTAYCASNGLSYSNIATLNVNGSQRDWYADLADALVNSQQSSGYWSGSPNGGNVLGTEWALLTLEMPTSGPYPPGSLELTKVDDINDGDCVGLGRQITYTIDYNYPAGRNLTDINDVNIIDYLPAEVDFNSASNGGSYDSSSHAFIWNLGVIHPGDAGFVTLTVEVNHPGPGSAIINHCEIRSSGQVIRDAYEYTPVCNASNPLPINGATALSEPLQLSWTAGNWAGVHRVYFGTSLASVTNATTASSDGRYRGTVSSPVYPLSRLMEIGAVPPGASWVLTPYVTYYWRIDIDEVNDPCVWKGPVWSFTPAAYVNIDDFEDSMSTQDVNANWPDHYSVTGCTDQTGNAGLALIQDASGKHLQYTYNNGGHSGENPREAFSEAKRPYSGGTSFTGGGVISPSLNTLRIDYKGTATNAANNLSLYDGNDVDQMYVAIEDAAGNVSVYLNPDHYAQQAANWTPWYIKLTDLNDITNINHDGASSSGIVNLNAITGFAIGFGQRCNNYDYDGVDPNSIVMFDNIRLEQCGLSADFAGDCLVNFNDFAIMGQEWLTSGIKADIYKDGNNRVDLMDLEVLAEEWLK